MSNQIINAFPEFKKEKPLLPYLKISEMFSDTIQGENFVGVPATFVRTMGCTLNCQWCDSKEVWRKGNPYSVMEILELWEANDLPRKFKEGQHLIFTGGSPLLQQDIITDLLHLFLSRYEFKPFVEFENEVVLKPKADMLWYVDIWNNSPKLENSGVTIKKRYNPDLLKFMSSLSNSWFKFVITRRLDWDEIMEDFIQPGLIKKNQIVLMPEGQTRLELEKTREIAVRLAIENNVRFTDRLHITLWDKKTGV